MAHDLNCGVYQSYRPQYDEGYRDGVKAEKERTKSEVEVLCKQLAAAQKYAEAKQAKIDALMLEFCPEEMTPEQMEEWARNQRPAAIEQGKK